jgi:hypothetical protein
MIPSRQNVGYSGVSAIAEATEKAFRGRETPGCPDVAAGGMLGYLESL